MAILRCHVCDESFDTDKQVDARYYPVPECEDCILEMEEENKKLQDTWLQLDQDTEAIADFCEDKL